MIKLSKRLQAIYDLIPNKATLVDVGTDHGWLIIKAIQSGKAVHAYGLDIALGPLSIAQANLKAHGISAGLELMQLDGLKGFEAFYDVCVIAGLGAQTIWTILKGATLNPNALYILQSNTDVPWLREQLLSHGFVIEEERYLIDKGKNVFIIACRLGSAQVNDWDVVLGPVLRKQNDPVYHAYLVRRCEQLGKIVTMNPEYEREHRVIAEYLKGDLNA